MDAETWRTFLVVGLGANAAIGLGYRIYRHRRGGPIGDVWGQAVLAAVLSGVALGVSVGSNWARWIALVYAALFGLIAMPVWVLGVLLPMRPRAIDYAFTVTYWLLLVVIAVAAVLA